METYQQFIEYLERPNGIFDANDTHKYGQMQQRVFVLLMHIITQVNILFPFGSDERTTSFVLTKTIGVVSNGEAIDYLQPSQMLKIEKFFYKLLKVSRNGHCNNMCIYECFIAFSCRICSVGIMIHSIMYR